MNGMFFMFCLQKKSFKVANQPVMPVAWKAPLHKLLYINCRSRACGWGVVQHGTFPTYGLLQLNRHLPDTTYS